MSFGAFFSAVSGVKGNLFSMNIVGNNIANANTVAFKSSRANFQEALVQTLRSASTLPRAGGLNPMQVGLGMEVSGVTQDFGQGMLQETGIVTDLAIQGEGFFIVKNGDTPFYTRAGGFTFDADGNLVARGSGYLVQGWMADETGRIPTGSPVGDVQLPFGQAVAGRTTTEVTLDANLDAAATTSDASLVDSGTTNIELAQGLAKNGAGGRHEIAISGTNATRSTQLGNNAAGATLTGSESLSSLGVSTFGFALVVDGKPPINVQGLDAQSTVDELISSINDLGVGVEAMIEGGEVRLTRGHYGDGVIYNFATSAAAAGDIPNRVFGAAVASAFSANNGTPSSITATDVFTPTGEAALGARSLTVGLDAETGLAVSVEDVGGGGIMINANSGLAAGNAIIDTAATEHRTSILVYDSVGNAHTLNMTLTRSGEPNQWNWRASFGEEDSATISSGGSGTVKFNNDGSLQSWLLDNAGSTLNFNPGESADPMQVEFATGTAGEFDGLTQFAAPFTAKAAEQDGYGMGTLTAISVGNTGVITGTFSNGVLRDLAQVVLADFNNSDGLTRVGGNLYQVSTNSGVPVIGAAATTIPGEIASGTLEMSNVDLSEEFVQMIVSQRGFQANARVITTGDEVMSDLINLKR